MFNEDEGGEQQIGSVEVMELEKKMDFPTLDDFRLYIRTYAILKNFIFEYVVNDSDRVRLKCMDPNYKWLCYARQNSSEPTVVVKTLIPKYNVRVIQMEKNPLANSKWVAKMLEEDMRVHRKTYTCRDIVLEC